MASRWSRVESVSEWPVPSPTTTLVVFDFDCTLTIHHMFHTLRTQEGRTAKEENPPQFFVDMFGGQPRIESLRHMLSALKSSGVQIKILSFGVEAEIQEALQSTDLIQFFDESPTQQQGVTPHPNIYGNTSFARHNVFNSRFAKADMLKIFAEQAQDKIDRILFVDDDRGNFPGRGLLGAQKFDTFILESSTSAPIPQLAILFVYPAGVGKNADGLEPADMDELVKFVVGTK